MSFPVTFLCAAEVDLFGAGTAAWDALLPTASWSSPLPAREADYSSLSRSVFPGELQGSWPSAR